MELASAQMVIPLLSEARETGSDDDHDRENDRDSRVSQLVDEGVHEEGGDECGDELVGEDPSVVAGHVQVAEGDGGVRGEHGVVATDAEIDETDPDEEAGRRHLGRERERADEQCSDDAQEGHGAAIGPLVHQRAPHRSEQAIAHRGNRPSHHQEVVVADERLSKHLPVGRHERRR